MSKEPENTTQPAEILNKMLGGYMQSQVLYVAAKLALFDVLRDEPKTSQELASLTKANEPSLRRLLGYLTSVNMLREDTRGRFKATEMGELLQSNHPHSLYPWALLLGAPLMWKPWGEFYETIKTGEPAFDRVFGKPFFQYLGQNPEDAALFNAAMTQTLSDSLSDITEVYDFSDFRKIVDVGGGHGVLLRGILERYPHIKGVLFDLPSVVADAKEIKGSAVEDRCEIAGGDMFQSVPMGGDAYILKRIIHGWSDKEAIEILRNCKQAMSEQGKILIVDRVLKPNNQPDPGKSPDLMMLILMTGRERTEKDFRELFEATGLRLSRIIPTKGQSVIEGVRK